MSSGIGNRRIMQALGRVLGIEDVKQAPARFKVDELVPTIALEPGWANYQQTQLFTGNVPIAGLNFVDWCFLGPGCFTFCSAGIPAFSVDDQTAQRECVILGLNIELVYDAAGRNADAAAAAAAGLQVLRQADSNPVSLVNESSLKSWAVINNYELSYMWSHPWWLRPAYLGLDPSPGPWACGPMAMVPVLVPAGSRYLLRVNREINGSTSGVWPANTQIRFTAQVVSCPKGMRPPGI